MNQKLYQTLQNRTRNLTQMKKILKTAINTIILLILVFQKPILRSSFIKFAL